MTDKNDVLIVWLENIVKSTEELGLLLDEVSKRTRNPNVEALYDALVEERRRLFALHQHITDFLNNEYRKQL